ncbi:hypothetical protein Nmel_009765 [Mimus melanotis]
MSQTIKASKPSAARCKSDSFQHLEEPGGAALPVLHCAQHRGQRPLRPGRAARHGERHGRERGQSLARPGRCAEPSLPPGRAGGRRGRTTLSPAPLPASRPLWVALLLKPRRSAKPSADRARPAAAADAPSPCSPPPIRPGPGGGKGKAANPGTPRVPPSLIYSVAVQHAWKRLLTLICNGPA